MKKIPHPTPFKKSKYHLAFGLAILTLGAQVSARECPTSGTITYSCDVTSSRTNQFLFSPSTAITVNVIEKLIFHQSFND